MTDVSPLGSPSWSPLSAKQRRVLGTLMEKSKTTPDAYPMSFAGLTTGCNQKTNRSPITHFSPEQVEQIVEELKKLGAVALIQGSGRVEKVRHHAYQWIGLSKVEAAVMTELLLRGEQTVGELRTRASRLEPIADLQELQRLLDELASRQLVVMLTPPGRGQVVTHNLYPEWELEEVRSRVAAGGVAFDDEGSEGEAPAPPRLSPSAVQSDATVARGAANVPAATPSWSVDAEEWDALKKTIANLTARLEFLERELGVNAKSNEFGPR